MTRRRVKNIVRAYTINVGFNSGNWTFTDGNGLPADSLAVLGPRGGDEVFMFWWVTDESATLTIRFKNASPFSQKQLTSHKGVIKAKLRDDVLNDSTDTYPYNVQLARSGKKHKTDPQIIIS